MIVQLNTAGLVKYNPNTIPLGFAQVVLNLQDTQFILTNSVEFWDRALVNRIKFGYAPMGTEAVYLNMFITGGNKQFLRPPYSNGPLLITYDPTANVNTAIGALIGMERLGNQDQQPTPLALDEVQRAIRQSQHYIGETTKTFKGNIVSPRAMMFTNTGSQGFTMTNEIDLGNQYLSRLGGNGQLIQIQDYQHVTTYGALNFIIPRSTTQLEGMQENMTYPIITVNVSITYYLELYGHT